MFHRTTARNTTILIILMSLLSFYAALRAVINENLYRVVYEAGTITEFLIAGSLAQDILIIPAALILLLLSVYFLKIPNYKVFITMLGITGYLFYGFGLYVIQGQYTSIYLVYLAIFGLSIYALIYGLLSFDQDTVKTITLARGIRLTIGSFLLFILIVLVPIWLIQIGGDIAQFRPGDTYAVYILDLTIEFPAFIIIAFMLFRGRPFGNILAGVALFKVLTVCLSVAFGEWYIAFYRGFTPNYGMLGIFVALTVVSMILLALYLVKLKSNSAGVTEA